MISGLMEMAGFAGRDGFITSGPIGKVMLTPSHQAFSHQTSLIFLKYLVESPSRATPEQTTVLEANGGAQQAPGTPSRHRSGSPGG